MAKLTSVFYPKRISQQVSEAYQKSKGLGTINIKDKNKDYKQIVEDIQSYMTWSSLLGVLKFKKKNTN